MATINKRTLLQYALTVVAPVLLGIILVSVINLAKDLLQSRQGSPSS